MNTITPDQLDEIFKDEFAYYGGKYRILTQPVPIAVGAGRQFAYALNAYHVDSQKVFPEIYITMKILVESKVDVFNNTVKKIKYQIQDDYAGKDLAPEKSMKHSFRDKFSFGLIFWTYTEHNDEITTFDNEDDMLNQINVMRKLNKNFRFRVFRNEEKFVEYFPDIYD